jgi:hypothetical protein
MPSSTVVSQAIDRTAADAAHAKLAKFVHVRNPDVVDKRIDMALNFDGYLRLQTCRRRTRCWQASLAYVALSK